MRPSDRRPLSEEADLDRWWLQSSPEHYQLGHLDPPPLRQGGRLRIQERIAGIPGTATGTIIRFEPGEVLTWEAQGVLAGGARDNARRGCDLADRPHLRRSRVSATVWARFQDRWGRLIERGFRVCRGVEKDRKHARTSSNTSRRPSNSAQIDLARNTHPSQI